MNLLPAPRSLHRRPGSFFSRNPLAAIQLAAARFAPDHPEGYTLTIDKSGISVACRTAAGLRAATATLQQLLREYGQRLPCLKIRDWPDFARRGVMLDISRGRVPRIETLLDLAEKLAGFKINELQLYTEHTFAYRQYASVWRSWGALTASEIRRLDARCRELGIDLIPNQNSFGHLRYFLADPRLKPLAEIPGSYEAETRDFLRRPTTLAPRHPGTLPFLRGLYDELLPNFSSRFFNVGCDETWDLGKGQSKRACAQRGKGQVYLDFLKQIHREVAVRNRTMMFWGDIILKYPALIRQLPKNVVALNWGYEANHPFAKEAAQFAQAGIPFYVCPGTSTWQTLIGKHDNALANLKAAARIGKKFGAAGYLNTDWGDGGHPQPLAVSWPLYAAGAALAWNAKGIDEATLKTVLSRDIFEDPSGQTAAAALALGRVHRNLGIKAVNETPLGTVIAAPLPADRELFCRNGLKWAAQIPTKKIEATLEALEQQRRQIQIPNPSPTGAGILALELDLAARMAAESCHYMLWQQALTQGDQAAAAQRAKRGVQALRQLTQDFAQYWPLRNKGTPKHCTPFLAWRIQDYRAGKTPFPAQP
jgi:hexosaminidase